MYYRRLQALMLAISMLQASRNWCVETPPQPAPKEISQGAPKKQPFLLPNTRQGNRKNTQTQQLNEDICIKAFVAYPIDRTKYRPTIEACASARYYDKKSTRHPKVADCLDKVLGENREKRLGRKITSMTTAAAGSDQIKNNSNWSITGDGSKEHPYKLNRG